MVTELEINIGADGLEQQQTQIDYFKLVVDETVAAYTLPNLEERKDSKIELVKLAAKVLEEPEQELNLLAGKFERIFGIDSNLAQAVFRAFCRTHILTKPQLLELFNLQLEDNVIVSPRCNLNGKLV